MRRRRTHLACLHSRDAFDLANAIRHAPTGAKTERKDTSETLAPPAIAATVTGMSPATSIPAPAMNIGVRKARRDTGSIAMDHLPGERLNCEPRREAAE